MITIKEFLESIDYKMSTSDDYLWLCYGENARGMDYWNNEHGDNGVSISCIFDTQTQVIYEMQAWDGPNEREYRWINPDYKNIHLAEAINRNIDPDVSYDDKKFIDIDLEDDMLEKMTAIFKGEDYDTRVKIELTLGDKEMFQLMTLAHEADMTLNQFVEKILREIIERHDGNV